ncbi:AAA family ATPase [bacterium]|nr:AAA family ATPase [bacterium]
MLVVYGIVGFIFLGLVYYFLISKREKIVITNEFREILDIIETTNQSLFISGKAGTGKSTLLKYFASHTLKNHVILAPTGVAALNVKGQTIHSFFRFPPKVIDPSTIEPNFARNALFRNIQTIVIDEISMVNANVLHCIDTSLRINRNTTLPFGGIQMVFIGDLFQLPPVVATGTQEYFRTNYGGEYFFYCPSLRGEFEFHKRELTTVFRQRDEDFKEILNRVRLSETTFEDFVKINTRHISNITKIEDTNIVLTTTNRIAKTINRLNMERISSEEYVNKAHMEGKIKEDFDKLNDSFSREEITEDDFDDKLENKFPANVILKLRNGCQVMMIKNDSSRRWVNGSLGRVTKLTNDRIWVKLDSGTHEIEREEWTDISYKYDALKKEIREIVKGTFRQFPLKAAWAITIHKSQGKTFDRITIDVGNGAFSHGQTYVALSRCKTLSGITLYNEIQQADIIVDQRVVDYYKDEFPSTEASA